jgi:hypothetical protein
VTSIHNKPAQVNRPPQADNHDREFLTRGINAAIARARHQAHSLEAIAAALRHKQATVAEVREWLKEEGLDQLVARHMRGAL